MLTKYPAASTASFKIWRNFSTHSCLAVLLFICIVLTPAFGAAPFRVALDKSAETQITSVKTITGIYQQEVGSSIKHSNALAGWGAVIDSSRSKKAESRIIPVRDALLDYDQTKSLTEALNKELNKLAWMKCNTVEVSEINDGSTLRSLVEKSGVDVVLIVRPEFELLPKFNGVAVTAYVSLHPRTAPLTAQQKDPNKRTILPIYTDLLHQPYGEPPGVLYQNVFTTVQYMPNWPASEPKDEAAVIQLLAANTGQRVRMATDACMVELAQMIAFDLTQSGLPDGKFYKIPSNQKKVKFENIAGFGYGYSVHEAVDRIWIRSGEGGLFSRQK